ncbi:MAG TPA: LAGLIDADG family homing endonuclease, partial [Dehalococcoidia bacterium]
MRNIREVGLHDPVLNSLGEETEVAKIMRRGYRGELVEIEPRSPGNRFHVTTEHPVLTIRRERVRSSLRAAGRWPDINMRRLASAEPEYVPARELQEGDLLVFPINQVERDDKSLSDDFLRLLGYYVAEGCATMFNGCKAVEFSFGDHEPAAIEDVATLIHRLTGKRGSRTHDRSRHGVCLVVYSDELWDLMVEHGGKYADGKRFSKAVMDLPPVRQKLAIDTYYVGDGSVARRGRRLEGVRAATVSRQLAFQLQEMLARQGIFAFLNTREAFDEAMKDGRVIHHKKKYVLYYSRNARGRRAIRRDNCFLVPIRRLRRQPYDGFVYNFETAGEPHSYLVKGFAVHNCTAPIRDENQLHAAVV